MTHEIARFAPHKTAKVAAAIYGLISIPLVPIFWLASLASPNGIGIGGVFMLLLPVLYAGLGYVFTGLGCLTYNFVAGLIGGIEVDIDAVAVSS